MNIEPDTPYVKIEDWRLVHANLAIFQIRPIDFDIEPFEPGQYATLGLAAYIFVNNEEDRYMMLEIFLLPGQMLPEHWHVEDEKNPAKREGWLVRWGSSHIVGIDDHEVDRGFGGRAPESVRRSGGVRDQRFALTAERGSRVGAGVVGEEARHLGHSPLSAQIGAQWPRMKSVKGSTVSSTVELSPSMKPSGP